MLQNATAIKGYSIVATDGPLGSVSDLLFDDFSWKIRWVVVDTGDWLPGRKVLLPTSVLGHLESGERKFTVRLTKREVEESPDIDAHLPVSRQMEVNVFDYYGWSPYWGSGFYVGRIMDRSEAAMPLMKDHLWEAEAQSLQKSKGDQNLRSTEVVTGYHIHASDGEIGHVEDFLIEDMDWSIHYIVVDTKNWWPGERVLISPRTIQDINWSDKLVNLKGIRQSVKDSHTYNKDTLIDRAYDRKFHSYYDELWPNG